MGSLSLTDMLEHGSKDQALQWHLSSNHYPPLPAGVFALAKRAIRLANRGKWESKINLGNVGTFRGSRYAPVRECIRAWHLDQFLDSEED